MDYPVAMLLSVTILGVIFAFVSLYNGRKKNLSNSGHNEMRDECKVLFERFANDISEVKDAVEYIRRYIMEKK
jgi:hypothetical protein